MKITTVHNCAQPKHAKLPHGNIEFLLAKSHTIDLFDPTTPDGEDCRKHY